MLRSATSLPVSCLLLLAPAACSSIGGVFDDLESTAADVLLPPEEEVKLGEELSAEVERQATLHPSGEVRDYVRDLGREVASHATAPAGIEFSFDVLDDDAQVNAFALPGGYVYVYSGLLLAAESEAELAAVLAHETAHVTERHVAERLVAAYGLEKVTAIVTGRDPSQASQIVSGLLSQGVLLDYGRDQESEADRVGIEVLIESGYDPRAFVDFFRKLEGGSGTPTFLSSHPDPAARIRAVERALEGRDDLPDFRGGERYGDVRRRV